MADHSSIEWTEATWNPIAGCSIVSPGCTNCYAMRRVAPRLSANPATPHYHGTVEPSKGGPVWTGRIGIASDRVLTQPLRWKRPRMIFVNSTSDLFHPGVPDAVIDRIFAVMALCPQHTFQILTKRPERMRDYLRGEQNRRQVAWFDEFGLLPRHVAGTSLDVGTMWPREKWPLSNVWLGTSVEDQRRADERIPHLLATPAAIRFISAEPLLGPIDLRSLDVDGESELDAIRPTPWIEEVEKWRDTEPEGEWQDSFLDWFDLSEMPTSGNMHPTLDWVIVGGESGNGARPMHPDWARALRDQCAAAGVPFFFKQWGEWAPDVNVDRRTGKVDTALFYDDEWSFGSENLANEDGIIDDEPDLYRVGKHAAGRLLDGITHDAMPAR